ncbi:hypothetical protein D3C73_583020 [compost metagenome]
MVIGRRRRLHQVHDRTHIGRRVKPECAFAKTTVANGLVVGQQHLHQRLRMGDVPDMTAVRLGAQPVIVMQGDHLRRLRIEGRPPLLTNQLFGELGGIFG